MSRKITLDIDFDNDEVKEITIPQEKNKDKEYVKKLIQMGLDICKKDHNLISQIIEDSKLFINCGLNEDMLMLFNYLTELYENIIPDILLANYDHLIEESSSLIEEGEGKDFFKSKRKLLLKRIQELDNKGEQ